MSGAMLLASIAAVPACIAVRQFARDPLAFGRSVQFVGEVPFPSPLCDHSSHCMSNGAGEIETGGEVNNIFHNGASA